MLSLNTRKLDIASIEEIGNILKPTKYKLACVMHRMSGRVEAQFVAECEATINSATTFQTSGLDLLQAKRATNIIINVFDQEIKFM